MLAEYCSKKACLSVHVSGLVTCVTLTWTLPKLEKVRKTTNIVRAYIFSIFSVLVCIPEGTHQNRIVKKISQNPI